MYTGLNEDLCCRAWHITRPAVVAAANEDVTNKLDGHLVVLDPHRRFNGERELQPSTILFSTHVGDLPSQKYTTIAINKAHVSWRTGLPSRVVQQQAPHLYATGMTKWGGSVVRDGLIVAFSGVQPVFDEMIADWMASALIALCRHEMTKPEGVMAGDSAYIGIPDFGTLAPIGRVVAHSDLDRFE